MGGQTTSNQQQTQSQNSQQFTTGTPFAQDIIGQAGTNNLIGQVFQNGANGGYQGDREAGFNIPTQVGGTWGPAPTTFTAQQTTGQNPTQTHTTDVNVNYQPGIATGLANAQAQQGQLTDISNAGLTGVQTAINSPNQGLDAMLERLRSEHAITSAQSTQAMADVAGANGAFGGTSFARDNAMQSGRQQSAFDDAAANLLWQDQARRDEWLRSGAGIAAQYAGIGDLTAGRMLNYGNMGLANDQNTANVNDANAQADANNAWNQGQLNDANTAASVEDQIRQWEAAFQISQQNAANGMTTAGLQQQNAQTAINNDMARFGANNESMNQMLQQLSQLMGISAMAPGGQTVGDTTTRGSSTQSQGASSAQMIGSILSIMALAASERRFKTNIVPLYTDSRGIKWYSFRYKDDPAALENIGVMVDEVEHIPGVVVQIGDVKLVDYHKLSKVAA